MWSRALDKSREWVLNNYDSLLGLLAGILVFRKPATIAIIAFIVLNLLIIKRFEWKNKLWMPLILISIPLVLDIIFLWNNDEILQGLKQMEKRLAFLVFPVILLSLNLRLNLHRILKVYTTTFTTILILLLTIF